MRLDPRILGSGPELKSDAKEMKFGKIGNLKCFVNTRSYKKDLVIRHLLKV